MNPPVEAASGREIRRETSLDRSQVLVCIALSAVADLEAALARFEATGTLPRKGEFLATLEQATLEGVNLLKARHPGAAPWQLASLERTGSGCALHAAVLAVDPAALTMSAEDGSGPLDALLADDADIALAGLRLRSRLAAAASALSVAAARLALQARFVDAILDEEAPGPPTRAAPEALDAAAAREAALAVGALLSGKPLTIATGNRRALDTLFASMASGGAST